jgi:hypothetical protein
LQLEQQRTKIRGLEHDLRDREEQLDALHLESRKAVLLAASKTRVGDELQTDMNTLRLENEKLGMHMTNKLAEIERLQRGLERMGHDSEVTNARLDTLHLDGQRLAMQLASKVADVERLQQVCP